jgi:hypothetical protein
MTKNSYKSRQTSAPKHPIKQITAMYRKKEEKRTLHNSVRSSIKAKWNKQSLVQFGSFPSTPL